MSKLAGAALAMLLAFQAGLPSLGLEAPLSNFVALAATVAVAGIAYFIPSPDQGT